MSYGLNDLAEKLNHAVRRAAILRTESVHLDLQAPEARDLLVLLRQHIERMPPAPIQPTDQGGKG